MYYGRARYYSSEKSAYLSRDPIRQIGPRSVNPYQFAFNNPLAFADCDGLSAVLNLRQRLRQAALKYTEAVRVFSTQSDAAHKANDLAKMNFARFRLELVEAEIGVAQEFGGDPRTLTRTRESHRYFNARIREARRDVIRRFHPQNWR